ncbi:hypothetical protein EP227_01280 [bacterium]|nr:MAG: hypothetical protein EP227_01280 [bacterium]
MKKIVLILSLSTAILFGCVPPEKKVKSVPAPPPPEQAVEPVSSPPQTTEQERETVFYPMPPQQPRLQFLASFSSEQPDEIRSFRLGDIQHFIQIQNPYDIESVKGKIYLSDRISKKIIIVNLENKVIDHIAEHYDAAGIWVTEDDFKYAADLQKKQILLFDTQNKLVRTFGEVGQLAKPVDVAVYGNNIYVCDLNRHQVIVIDKESGKTVQTLGSIGTEEGSLFKPTHVTVDREGNIYVNDAFNFRIQKFDPNGNFLKAFGYPGDTLGGFARPKGLGVDREGRLYVVDAAFENVQIFDDETTDLLLFFGGFGLEPGKMYLPNGIHIDYNNMEYFRDYVDEDFKLEYLIYVSNRFGPTKINVYGFGKWIGQPLPGIEKKPLEDKGTSDS